MSKLDVNTYQKYLTYLYTRKQIGDFTCYMVFINALGAC